MSEIHTIELEDGCLYVGEMKDGKEHGKGIYTFSNGSKIYEGEWKDGLEHGKGIYTWTNGSIYEGRHEHGDRIEGTIKHGTLKITGQIKTIDNRTAKNSYKEDVELIVTDKDGNKTKFKYGSEIKGLILIE